MIHEPYFRLTRASRLPLVMAVAVLGALALGLGEPHGTATAGVLPALGGSQPSFSSPSMLRDIGRRALELPPSAAPSSAPVETAASGIALLNRDRAVAGLPALSESTALDQVAATRAQQMVQDGLTHVRPGTKVFAATQLLQQNHVAFMWDGENIYWIGGPPFDGAMASAEAWWMTSPEHRANILGQHFHQVGIGTAIAGDKMFLSAVFTD